MAQPRQAKSEQFEVFGIPKSRQLELEVTDDVLLYYTWSQGFRPGGFNRGVSGHLPAAGIDQYFTPATYSPDTLTNNELGWKTEFFAHRVQFNGAVYQEIGTTHRWRSSTRKAASAI